MNSRLPRLWSSEIWMLIAFNDIRSRLKYWRPKWVLRSKRRHSVQSGRLSSRFTPKQWRSGMIDKRQQRLKMTLLWWSEIWGSKFLKPSWRIRSSPPHNWRRKVSVPWTRRRRASRINSSRANNKCSSKLRQSLSTSPTVLTRPRNLKMTWATVAPGSTCLTLVRVS